MPYSGYHELNDLPPEAFLEWRNFETSYDRLPSNAHRAEEQYQHGLKTGREFKTIEIRGNSTWAASGGPNGCCLSSYEGIGYHACTKDLLRGFLDSDAEVQVYRWGREEPVVIKPAKQAEP